MKTMLIFILFGISFESFSQSGWQVIYQGNSSTGQYFKDIAFFDSQTGWVLSNITLRKTINSGINWITHNIAHQSNQLNCFFFYSKDIGWVGEKNFLNYTSNSGINWMVVNNTVSNPMSLFFKDPLTGWICGDTGIIKKTTDGGYNWVTIPSGTEVNLRSIAFADDNIGICAGDWGTILSTSNGGVNWITYYDNYLGFFTNVELRNSQTCFVSGTGNFIYRTTNSGLNWTGHYVNSSHITSIQFSQNGNAFAFGASGSVFKSTDNGNIWNQLPANGLFSLINAASITPGDHIWIAADSGLIYNSTNLGTNWNLIHREYLTKEHLNSVYFTDQQTGFACGENGILLRSTNGGVNWLISNLGISYGFKDIRFVNNLTGFIAGRNISPNGVILRTSSGGDMWQIVFNDSSQINSLQFINPNTGWAAGNSGCYLKTSNGGINWTRFRFESANLNEICFLNDNTGFIGKEAGFYRTTNGGLNWIQISANNTGAIQFTGNTAYAYTSTSNALYLLKTTNAGSNWQQIQIPGGLNQELFFINENTGWILAGNSIRKTVNGGINWLTQATGINSIYGNRLHFLDNNYGWCVGMYGGIMKTTTGGIGITAISTEVPRAFSLLQNYPNPFNPSTKIRFHMPVSGNAAIIIYDITGKQICTILDQNLLPGIYETDWNALNYPSGIYFYRFTTNSFTQTKKMVLLK